MMSRGIWMHSAMTARSAPKWHHAVCRSNFFDTSSPEAAHPFHQISYRHEQRSFPSSIMAATVCCVASWIALACFEKPIAIPLNFIWTILHFK